MVGLRHEPLSAEEVYAALADDRAGGLTVFVGAVRDSDSGRKVRSLSYTAHPSAGARLEQVATAASERFDVLGVAAAHRLGDLQIGDLAVVVGACAVHREEAFAACRWLIDEVKATVPIWKQQVFADGSQEWVGSP